MSENNSSVLFGEPWLKTQRQRYGNRPRALRSWPYLIATDAEFVEIRQQIETWLMDLPAATAAKMIPTLQSPENFWHTYHELVVGSSLRDLGWEMQYEKLFDQQTPDWFCFKNPAQHPFIVEVFTLNISEAAAAEENKLSDLRRRIGEIKQDVAVRIAYETDSVVATLDSGHNKHIANTIDQWLKGANLDSDDTLCVDGISFQIIDRNKGWATLQYMGFIRNIRIDWNSLRTKIEEKVYKYKSLAVTNKLPLVIAVASGPGSDYTSFELDGVLRRKGGLFLDQPLLSGAFWISRNGFAQWRISYFANPHATYPVPKLRLVDDSANHISEQKAVQFEFCD